MIAPERGDLIQVDWVDIAENPVGDPDTCTLPHRTNFGLFWEIREDHGIKVLVTTTTQEETDHTQMGYCIYPLAIVTKYVVVKKGRKRVQKKRPGGKPGRIEPSMVPEEASVVPEKEVQPINGAV